MKTDSFLSVNQSLNIAEIVTPWNNQKLASNVRTKAFV